MSKGNKEETRILEAGNKIIKIFEEQKYSNNRYLSWNYCYEAFNKAKEEYETGKLDIQEDKAKIDYLALQLAFYLASWGMYRASTFLLQCDYKVHTEAVKEILKTDKVLWNIEIKDFQDKEKYKVIKEKLFGKGEIVEKLKKIYSDRKEKVEINFLEISEITKNEKISDTLITKILLGTIGCIPAYDRYVVSSFKNVCIKNTCFNEKSFDEVCKKCTEWEEIIQKLNAKLNNIIKENIEFETKYPIMKIVDMCLWQYGVDLENTIILHNLNVDSQILKDKIDKEVRENLIEKVNSLIEKNGDKRKYRKIYNRLKNMEVIIENEKDKTRCTCLLKITKESNTIYEINEKELKKLEEKLKKLYGIDNEN